MAMPFRVSAVFDIKINLFMRFCGNVKTKRITLSHSVCRCLSLCSYLHVCLCFSLCRPTSLWLCMYVCFPLPNSLYPCACLFVCVIVHLSLFLSLYVCLAVSVWLCMRLYLSVALCLPVYLCLSVCFFVCLSGINFVAHLETIIYSTYVTSSDISVLLVAADSKPPLHTK